VSSSAAGRSGRSLSGLDVGLVDEAIVEEKVVKAVVEEEVVETCGLDRFLGEVGGVSFFLLFSLLNRAIFCILNIPNVFKYIKNIKFSWF
jgi:hypothetical protein